jgi:hypothetical protein
VVERAQARDRASAEETASQGAPVACSADNTTGGQRPHPRQDTPSQTRQHQAGLAAKVTGQRERRPDARPRATTFPEGTATSQQAAEVKSSSPRRRSSGRSSQKPAQLQPKRHRALGSPPPQQRSTTAREASRLACEDPAASDKLTNDGSRSRRQPTRPPKPNPSGRDLDLRRRRPSRAPAHEDPSPSPLGPHNVAQLSGERSSSASAAGWAARF